MSVRGVAVGVALSVAAFYGYSKANRQTLPIDVSNSEDVPLSILKPLSQSSHSLFNTDAPSAASQPPNVLSQIVDKLPGIFPRLSKEWDSNWDTRERTSDTASQVSSSSPPSTPTLVNGDTTQLNPRSSRHLFLIRHGQYHTEKYREEDRKLTTLGQEQLDLTGQRLRELGFNFNRIVASTMTRAQESAHIIHKQFPDLDLCSDNLLEEGAPVPPEPPVQHWTPKDQQFLEDGPRIEAAFKKYFHRADVTQQEDSHEIIVCHGNVIRFFVCRALQVPPEAWLRMGLNHGSITWFTIRPSGRVILQSMGATGYMPPSKLTSL